MRADMGERQEPQGAMVGVAPAAWDEPEENAAAMDKAIDSSFIGQFAANRIRGCDERLQGTRPALTR
jgi:hypothetical protein